LQYIEEIFALIGGIIGRLGYWGIGVGMLLESACIPIPSELVLPLGGLMVAEGRLNLIGANIAVAIGSMAGSLIAYAAGYFGGRSLILKYGKYFFLSEKHFYQAERTFVKYGPTTVFFGRMLPFIRTFISLPAGIAQMDVKKFIIYSLVGMLPWNFLLIYLGCKFGQNYELLVGPIFHKFEYAVIGIVFLCMLFFVFRNLKISKKTEGKQR